MIKRYTIYKILYFLNFKELAAVGNTFKKLIGSYPDNKERNRYKNIVPCTISTWLSNVPAFKYVLMIMNRKIRKKFICTAPAKLQRVCDS